MISSKHGMQKAGGKNPPVPETRNIVFETQRMTLLEAVEERHEKQKKNILHRLVYVGKFNRKEAPETHAIKMIQVVSDIGQVMSHGSTTQPLTGMLLIYNDHFVHIVEALYDQLFRLIELCTEEDVKRHLNIATTRIINIAHDIPTRLYPAWQWKCVNIHRNEDLNKSQSLQVVSEFMERLLNLSIFMAKHSMHELETAIDALVESVRDSLPSEVAVHCMLELPLQSAEEYISAYKAPSTFVLDDEVVWPLVVNQIPLT